MLFHEPSLICSDGYYSLSSEQWFINAIVFLMVLVSVSDLFPRDYHTFPENKAILYNPFAVLAENLVFQYHGKSPIYARNNLTMVLLVLYFYSSLSTSLRVKERLKYTYIYHGIRDTLIGAIYYNTYL